MKNIFLQRRYLIFLLIMSLAGNHCWPALLSASSVPLAQAAEATKPSSFSDVAQNSAVFPAVEYLKAKNIVSGYADGTFRPEQTLSRAEGLKIVSKASQTFISTVTAPPSSPIAAIKVTFSDVKKSDWFYPYVQEAQFTKLVQGYPDGTFQPQGQLNVAEALKLATKIFASDLPSLPLATSPFADISPDAWYSPLAAYSKAKNLLLAQGDGKFHIDRAISRADFAILIYRLLTLREQHLDVFPLHKDWPTFLSAAGHFSLQYPFDWQKIDLAAPTGIGTETVTSPSQTIFWKQDRGNQQLSFARTAPNGATMTVTFDANKDAESLIQYLGQLSYSSSAIASAIQNITSVNTFSLTHVDGEAGVRDYYLQLPNKSLLILYTQTGNGLLQEQLLKEIDEVLQSIQYHPETTGTDKENFLSSIRQKILLSGKGKEALSAFTDLKIIETDTIGIGTGPVDYYYSQMYDCTLKYERNSQTLLGVKNGKTTAF